MYIYCSSGNGECLNDLPIGGRLNASALEGVNFDADAQCRAAYGPAARLCPAGFAREVTLDTSVINSGCYCFFTL